MEGSERSLVSLYTGAGGLDLGLEAAGFETRVAVEQDADCVATVKANRDWPVIEKDIHDVSSEDILEVAGKRPGDIDLLAGGPPCQPFSKSGYWADGDAGRLDDPRATTLEAYLRVLRDIRPQVFLLENVAGLAYKSKDEGVRLLRETVSSINKEIGTEYTFRMSLLNAADYGVPQERKRVFIIGERSGGSFDFPAPTHQRLDRGSAHQPGSGGDLQQLELEDLQPAVTAWDALGDLPEPENVDDLAMTGKWADLLPPIPEGCNYQFHTPRGDGLPLFGWRKRYWSFMLKLAKRFPSWTIQAQPGSAVGPFHWDDRWLSPRELCRLQTFPDNYTIKGSQRSAQKQLGNAVPSALAEVLGMEIRAQLLGEGSEVIHSATLVPDLNRPIPGPESPQSVPDKYKHRIDDHEPHPGEGKGPRASSASG